MHKKITYQIAVVVLVLVALMIGGCENKQVGSLYETNNVVSRTTPHVTSLLPTDSALAAANILTFNGTDFDPVPDNNFVMFKGTRAKVLSASATQLKVKAPSVLGVKMLVSVTVTGCSYYDTLRYTLNAAAPAFSVLEDAEEVLSVATDAAGNVYFGRLKNSVTNNIAKIAPDGSRSFVTPEAGGGVRYIAMKVKGTDTVLVIRSGLPYILAARISVSAAPGVYASLSGMGNPLDLDFDAYKNIWMVTSQNKVVRMLPNKTYQGWLAVDTTGGATVTLRSVRVFNGYVYVAGTRTAGTDIVQGVWKAQISGGVLTGSFDKYFDLSPVYGTLPYEINAVTFSSDGYMYLGTTSPDGIVIVTLNAGAAEPYYQSVFSPTILYFAWGTGPSLFVARKLDLMPSKDIRLYKANTEKTSAPYYGW